MERIKEFILEHKKISIIILALLIIAIILGIINVSRNNKIYDIATNNTILIKQFSVISEDNDSNKENILEVNLNDKIIEHYLKNRYESTDDNYINLDENYITTKIDISYSYSDRWNHTLNDLEYVKLNGLIKSIMNNYDLYNNIGHYYDGIPEKVIIENNKMAEKNNLNNEIFYTMYYYKFYTVDNDGNNTEIGTVYKESELRFIEYLYNLQ